MQVMTDYKQQAIDFLTATGATLKFTYDGFKKYFQDDKQPRNVFKWEITKGNKTIKGKFGDSIADSCKETPILQSNEPTEIYAGISSFDSRNKKIFFGITIKTSCDVLNRIDKKEIEVGSIINMQDLEREYNHFLNQYCTPPVGNRLLKITPTGIMSTIHSAKNYVEKRILRAIEELKKETVLLDQADNIVEPSAYDLLACLTKYNPGTFENFCGDYGYDTDSRKALKIYKTVVKEWKDLTSIFNEQELEALAEIS